MAAFKIPFMSDFISGFSFDGFRRIKVEQGTSSFDIGRDFRAFKELSVPAAESYIIKVIVPIDIKLTNLTILVDAGTLRITTEVGGTEGGTFTTLGPIIPKNNRSDRLQPFYVSQVAALGGGTLTGGSIIDVARLAAGNSANSSSVGGAVQDARGIAAGTYYFRFENVGSGISTGVFYANWSEI